MTIRKIESTRPAMVTGGHVIKEILLRVFRIPNHIHHKKTVVNAVFPLVNQDPERGWPWTVQIGRFDVVDEIVTRIVLGTAGAVHPVVHRNTPHAWIRLLAVNGGTFVSWATPDIEAFVVGP